VKTFEDNATLFTPENCRLNAERFSTEIFKKEFTSFVKRAALTLTEQVRAPLDVTGPDDAQL